MTQRAPTSTLGQWLVAVRGTGSIGLRHLRVFRDELGLAPIAVPVRHDRGASPELAGFSVVQSLKELQGQPGQRVAVIATDTARHLADATEALSAGFDVLVEKPLSPSASGIGDLRAAAAAAQRQVFVACNLRFSRGLRRFRELLPQIGVPSSVRIECQSYLPAWRPGTDFRRSYSARKGEGGALRDLIHEVDYALWLFGRPQALVAKLTNSGRLRIESEEAADLLWTVGGAVLSLRLDYVTQVARRRMRAFGADAELEWDATRSTVTLEKPRQPPHMEDVSQERDVMMADQARAFLGVLGGAINPGLATLQEAEFALQLCDTANASSNCGRELSIVRGDS